ncbi:MAG: Cu(I)-responsive transcriptional regulator [Kiloniellaceae bacterium]
MQIGTAAEQSRVPPKTIRYYESVGLIAPARRTASGYRDYGERDVQTLRFIQRARSLGFSISDVAGLLNLWHDRDRHSAQVKALADRHVAEIDRKIAELRGMRETLVHLITRCHGDDRPDCPILEDLAGAPTTETNGRNR